MNENEPFYRFRCEATGEPDAAELLIFAAIGDWEDMGEVSAKGFARDLAALPKSVKRIDIHINSPGGSLFEANAIYSRLADHRSNKHVYIDGIAASAASIIAMVGPNIYIRANATMMIHSPSGIVMGNADKIRKMAGALDVVTESMINIYSKRTKLERDEIRSMLTAETWFDPKTAVEKGFADEERGVVKAAALGGNKVIFNGAVFDLSRFHNVPAFNAQTQTERQTMPKKPKVNDDAGGGTAETHEGEGEGNGNGNGNGNGGEEHTEHTEHTETTRPAPATQPKPKAPTPPPGQKTPPQHAAASAEETDFDKGIKAERDRVTALQALSRPATAKIVADAIANGQTVADITAACIEAMDKASQQRDRHTDSSVLNGSPASDGPDGENQGKAFGSQITAEVEKKMKARGSRMRVSRSRS